jgi:enoyl-CoA hydratase/carnithine racemase
VIYPLTVPNAIVGAINGACAGLGMVQALMMDVRFAAAGAKFTTAFVRRGLIAEHGISWMLPRLVGTSVASDLLLSGRVFTSEEALELRLVNRVFPGEVLLDEALAYARDIAKNCAPASVAVMKHQLLHHQDLDVEAALEESNALMRKSLKRPDFKEGVASYVEKRPPAFASLDEATLAG